MKNNTNGITVGGQDLEEYLYEKEVKKEDKNIQHTHAEQTKAPVRLPMGKPRYTPRAERPGKCIHLTPKEIEMDHKPPNSYKTNQQKVIAVLLNTEKSLAFMDFAMAVEADRNSLSAVLSQVSTALEGCELPIKIGTPGGNVYSLTDEARTKTVAELDEMVKAYWRTKKRKPKFLSNISTSKLSKADIKAKREAKIAALKTAKANAEGPEPKPTDDGAKRVPPKETLKSILGLKAELDKVKKQIKLTKDQLPHPFSYPQIISEIGEAINNVPEGITVRFIIEVQG